MSSQGPLFPTAASGNTATLGGGSVVWTNPQNIQANDGVFASCLPGVSITDDLRGSTYGFTVPATATIRGILLEVAANSPATTNVEKFNVVALEGGGGASANRAAGLLTPTLTTFSFGGSADLWGTTWTPAQINAATFVSNISFSSTGGGPGTLQVDFHRITVFFTLPGSSQMFKMF